MTVNRYSDVKNALKSINIEPISRTYSLTYQDLVKFPAQFDIDNEEKIWFLKKTAIFAAGHLKGPAILATLTVFYFLFSGVMLEENK